MKKFIDYFLNYLQTEKDAANTTIHKYRADLERLFEYLQVTDINEINQNHLRDYLNHIRQTCSYTSSSIANKINILHHFFRFLHASGYISSNPAILIRSPRKNVYFGEIWLCVNTLLKQVKKLKHGKYCSFSFLFLS